MSNNAKNFYGIDDEIRELGYRVAKLSAQISKDQPMPNYSFWRQELIQELGRTKARLDWAIKCKEKHHGKSQESVQQSTGGNTPLD